MHTTVLVALLLNLSASLFLKPWRTIVVYSAAWGRGRQLQAFRNAGLLLLLAVLALPAHAAATGAITLVNKSSDVLTMYGGDSDHSCDANPGQQCTIELQPGEYNVLIVYIGTSHVRTCSLSLSTVTVVFCTLTDN